MRFSWNKILDDIIPLSCVSRDLYAASRSGQSNTDPQNLGGEGTCEDIESPFPKYLFRSDSSPSPVSHLHHRSPDPTKQRKTRTSENVLIIHMHGGFFYDNRTYNFLVGVKNYNRAIQFHSRFTFIIITDPHMISSVMHFMPRKKHLERNFYLLYI